MDSVREKRKEEISQALAFIQSPLAYPDPAGYQDFLTRLVCNLLEEGNAFFREQQWEDAVRQFTEALNVSSYAEGEEIQIPTALLESLYINRAAAYHSMNCHLTFSRLNKAKYDEGVEDSNSALEVCKESRRALFRKALCLKQLGKHKEAYDCTTICLLSNPQDEQVNKLAQELAIKLGMKIRKPYVSSKPPPKNVTQNGVNPPSVDAVVVLRSPNKPTVSSAPPGSSCPAASAAPCLVEALEDSEVMGDDLDSLLDSFPTGQVPSEVLAFSDPVNKPTAPLILPAPTPQLPPAFFISPMSQLNSLDSFTNSDVGTASEALDILDDLYTDGNRGAADASSIWLPTTRLENLGDLGSLDTLDDFLGSIPNAKEPKTELQEGEKPLDELLSEVGNVGSVPGINAQNGDVPKVGSTAMKQLDALDSFATVERVGAALPGVSVGGTSLDSLSDFSSNGNLPQKSPLSCNGGFPESNTSVTRSPKNHYKVKEIYDGTKAVHNPLSSTHEFLEACPVCFPRGGPSVYSFVHKPDRVHNCKKDILLCRRKAGSSSEWKRVRPLPAWTTFSGPFVLCRELMRSGELGVCKYGEKCNFAYNQLEIDVWTEERKGRLDRNALLGASPVKLDPVSNINGLLQEHKGMFIFLCQKCYDSKPRIISKRSCVSQAICSNLDARHNFDANKCLAFVVSTHNINYSKVRPLVASCHLDLCRQAIRYGCLREDSCMFAHSVIELKTWRVQRHTGITADDIVKMSMKYRDEQEQNSRKEKEKRLSSGGVGGKFKGASSGGTSLNMKMKFACAQCWRDGLISEPDKGLKHCAAKARHLWTNDRRVLLVRSSERSKWVQVRPLPHAKNFPLYYDMCAQILQKRKCTYTGNCSFAHSQEEKEMWMYMKNNELWDMQQVYDMWLALAAQSHQPDAAMCSQPNPEEKFIAMPTDFGEPMDGYHCRLCGKHSNSERQWQQHISSEKHKDRVFSCEGEDEALTWSYRFPGTRFKICPKIDDGCPEGVSCDYSHCPGELQEWIERRDFLRQKLAKAREDMLIMPDELDFGKYNFLLQD